MGVQRRPVVAMGRKSSRSRNRHPACAVDQETHSTPIIGWKTVRAIRHSPWGDSPLSEREEIYCFSCLLSLKSPQVSVADQLVPLFIPETEGE